MDDRTQGALLLAVGGVALRLGLTGEALSYVKAGLQPLLVISGVVLVVLGGVAVMRAFTRDPGAPDPGPAGTGDDGHHDGDGDGHGHGSRVAWLLVLPLLALLLVAPPPLGQFAAARQSTTPVVSTRTTYPPLPAEVDGAAPLEVGDFVLRALYDEARSVDGQPVRLVGFVSDTQQPGGFLLSRFALNCCAADARAISVTAISDEVPALDAWVEVVGTFEPRPGVEVGAPSTEPPQLRVTSVVPVEQPDAPYEY